MATSSSTSGCSNVGDGFRIGVGAPGYPYTAVNCLTVGRANRVTGARHVLRLIDGGLGRLPLPLGATGLNGGGFTVASENPVYVLGDYNSNTAAGDGSMPVMPPLAFWPIRSLFFPTRLRR